MPWHMGLSKSRDAYPHLNDAQFATLILRRTEPPGTSDGALPKNSCPLYLCPNCLTPVFAHSARFASGTGWPSFFEALSGSVKERSDWRVRTNGQWIGTRKEVMCAQCSGHLGHVFRNEHWATATGVRYCINSSALITRTSTVTEGEDVHIA